MTTILCMQSLPWVPMGSRFTEPYPAWQFKNQNCCMAKVSKPFERLEKSEEWTAALKDRDQGVRTAVVNALRVRISAIDQLTMGALVESPHGMSESF